MEATTQGLSLLTKPTVETAPSARSNNDSLHPLPRSPLPPWTNQNTRQLARCVTAPDIGILPSASEFSYCRGIPLLVCCTFSTTFRKGLEMTLKKISFRVPPGLWDRFSRQAKDLFLNRAPFLNHMIKRELPELIQDLGERRMSTAAKRYVSGQLKREGAKSVNIEVEEATAQMLNEAVAAANLVRDAFFCRLLIFLRSTDALLEHLDVPKKIRSSISTESSVISLEEMPTSPLTAMEWVRDDPLFYVRNYVENKWHCGIYLVQLPRSIDWAACYMEDKNVPRTRAYKQEERATAELYEAFETDALRTNKVDPKKRGGK